MKKCLTLIICVSVLMCGSLLMSSMANKPAKEAKALTSKSSKEAVTKKTGKFTTDKNAVRQQKLLNEVKKDSSIKQDPKLNPGSSPEDVHPSEQF